MEKRTTQLVDAARELLKQAGYFMDNLWHVDDVHFICEQLNLEKLDDNEAKQVFAIALEHFDGETGLSWPQLEKAVQLYLQRKSVLLAMCKGKAA